MLKRFGNKYPPPNSLLRYYLSYIMNDFLGNLEKIYKEKLVPIPIKDGEEDDWFYKGGYTDVLAIFEFIKPAPSTGATGVASGAPDAPPPVPPAKGASLAVDPTLD